MATAAAKKCSGRRRSGRNVLGKGAYGVVERQTIDGKDYAVKFAWGSAASKKALRKEAEILQKLTLAEVPNVPKFDSHCEDDGGSDVLVMDLLEGYKPLAKAPSLFTQVTSAMLAAWAPVVGAGEHSKRFRSDPVYARKLLIEVLRAVQTIHDAGYSQRDLHFENILVSHDANGDPKVKIIDFGQGCKLGAATSDCEGSANASGYADFMKKDYRFQDIQVLGVYLLYALSGYLLVPEDSLYAADNEGKWYGQHPTSTLRPAKHTGKEWDRIYYVLRQMMGAWAVCSAKDAAAYLELPIPS